MEVLAAIVMANKIMEVVSTLTTQYTAISSVINKAQSEGRTTLTKEEWDSAIKLDDDAAKKLHDTILAHGG